MQENSAKISDNKVSNINKQTHKKVAQGDVCGTTITWFSKTRKIISWHF